MRFEQYLWVVWARLKKLQQWRCSWLHPLLRISQASIFRLMAADWRSDESAATHARSAIGGFKLCSATHETL